MWLAIDTATDRASVAVGHAEADAVERELGGARSHAAGLLPLIEEAMRARGTTLDGLTGIALSDGPGSFTGLRIGASVAKAMVRARGLPLWTAPSLQVRAAGVARDRGEVVLAVTDALRGELYAAAYRFAAADVVVELPPSVWRPDALMAAAPHPDLLVGEAPEQIAAALERWAGTPLIGPPQGSPRAGRLIGLLHRRGGAEPVAAVPGWEPCYGRPAEAQTRWETAHGRPLPDPAGRAV